jgi:hypothetical protein
MIRRSHLLSAVSPEGGTLTPCDHDIPFLLTLFSVLGGRSEGVVPYGAPALRFSVSSSYQNNFNPNSIARADPAPSTGLGAA